MNYENAAFNFQALWLLALPLKTFNGFFGKNCYQTSDKICTTRWATCRSKFRLFYDEKIAQTHLNDSYNLAKRIQQKVVARL